MDFKVFKNEFTEEKLNELQIKKYIPLSEKIGIIDGLIENILINEDGLYKIDLGNYELYSVFVTIKYFTDLEFSLSEEEKYEYEVEDYDFIMENNIKQFIIDNVGSDYFKFKELLNKTLEQEVEQRNSLQSVIIKSVEKLVGTLNNLTDEKKMGKLVKQFEKVVGKNPELLSFLKNAKQLGVAK